MFNQAIERGALPDGAVVRTPEAEDFAACAVTAQGAWVLRVEEASLVLPAAERWGYGWAIEARVSVAFIDEHGNVLRLGTAPTLAAPGHPEPRDPKLGEPGRVENANCCHAPLTYFPRARFELASDYTGDGVEEVVVSNCLSDEGDHQSEYWLLSRERNTLRIVPTPRFEALNDVDGDGLLDLLAPPARSVGEVCLYNTVTPGHFLLAHHARPGAVFVDDDEAAQAHARRLCPKPPTKVQDVVSVVCAGLWGQSPGQIKQQLPSHCVHPASGLDDADECTEMAMLADTPWPFLLK